LGLWVVVVAILAYRYPASWHSWIYGPHARSAAHESTASTQNGPSAASSAGASASATTTEASAASAPPAHPWHGYAPGESAASAGNANPATAASASQSAAASASDAAPHLNDAQTALLMQARTAFWHHDLRTAEEDYRKLIKEVPAAPAPHGELGNIYYQTGRGKQAGEQYAAAAEALIALHRQAEAAALLPLVGTFDPSAAQKLAQALGESDNASGNAAENAPPMPPSQPEAPAAPQPPQAPVAPVAPEPPSNPSGEAEQPPQPAVPTISKSQYQTLMQAREAFMRHDVEKAKKEYLKLIAELPKAATPHGELGNLYYMTGKRKAAAEQYALAAQALIAEGRVAQARGMLPMIGKLDPAQAEAVSKTLQARTGKDGQ
jgi:hypothetical protein